MTKHIAKKPAARPAPAPTVQPMAVQHPPPLPVAPVALRPAPFTPTYQGQNW